MRCMIVSGMSLRTCTFAGLDVTVSSSLSAQKDELAQTIKDMTEKNERKREELDKLDESLEKFIQNAAGMQEMLGLSVEMTQGSTAAKNLPGPLYTILRMAEAYNAAFPGTVVASVGAEGSQAPKQDGDRASRSEDGGDEAEFYQTSTHYVTLTLKSSDKELSLTCRLHYLPMVGKVG